MEQTSSTTSITSTTSVSTPSLSTITVRLIKSFHYKNYRNLVFHSVDLDATNLTRLAEMVNEKISSNAVLSRLFPSTFLDTFKLYYQPHAAKTNNPIINVGQDEKLVLVDWVKGLRECGLQDGCEISYFNWGDYEEYCRDPKALWE